MTNKTLKYWLIENKRIKADELAVGTSSDVDEYLEEHQYLCNPRSVEYTYEFEDCIDLWHENNCQ